jgi:hypothetical protein
MINTVMARRASDEAIRYYDTDWYPDWIASLAMTQ